MWFTVSENKPICVYYILSTADLLTKTPALSWGFKANNYITSLEYLYETTRVVGEVLSHSTNHHQIVYESNMAFDLSHLPCDSCVPNTALL